MTAAPLPAKFSAGAGRIPLSLFLTVFLGMGLLFLGLLLQEMWKIAETLSWPAHPCMIVRSEVVADSSQNSSEPYHFRVEYSYQINGQTHVASAYRGPTESSSKWSEMETLRLRYPAGSATTCFVNPANPGDALLEHKSLWIGLGIFLPLIFILIGAGGLWFVWKAPAMPTRPLSPTTALSAARWIPAAFFGVFLLIGLAAAVTLGRDFVDLAASGSWVKTPCTVQSSRVLTHDDDDGDTYSVDVLYQYSFKNQTYHSNRYSFVTGSSSGHQAKAAIVDQLPPGAATFCYVNPDHPSEAVLYRGWSWELLILLVPLVFVLVGAGGLYFFLRPNHPFASLGLSPDGKIRNRSFSGAPLVSTPNPGVPLVLKPKTSAFRKMLGVALIAVFWNGIISIFLFEAVGSWRQGSPDWFLMIFMIPFVTIGLGLIGGIFYFMLAIGNPTAKLALNTSTPALGESLRVGWGFDGKTERLESLRLYLEAREEATYRRGTSTSTDRNIFFRQDIISLSDPRQIAQGMAEVTIPEDLMHSLSSANNKIVWTLTLHGSIPRWPDVKEEFEITVHPLRRLL